LLNRIQNTLIALAGLAALALGGSALAGAASNPTTTTGTSPSGTSTQSGPSFSQHGTAAHEDQEKPVTGGAATKAQGAAEKSVGSGSKAGAVTTDIGGNGYEVTVTKPDGSKVEVHLDQSFNVIQGHGGHHGGGLDGDAAGA
jgi:hypothetical protein